MNNVRSVTVHTFSSAKGGVGKTALAVAAAKILADRGRSPIFVDCDLTGTSVADGLRLRAPETTSGSVGTVDLCAPPTGKLLTVAETQKLRGRRRDKQWKDVPPPPPYFNDAFAFEGAEHGNDCRIDAMIWRHERDDGVRYLPSSPFRHDALVALGWLYQEIPLEWMRRLAWLLDLMVETFLDLTDIIIDLPPTLVGFAHEASVLVSQIEKRTPWPEGYPKWDFDQLQWKANPILVVTPDLNALLVSLEYVARTLTRIPSLLPIVNQNWQGLAVIREEMRRRLPDHYGILGLEQKLCSVDHLASTLGRLFWDGDLVVNEDVRRLAEVLRLEVG